MSDAITIVLDSLERLEPVPPIDHPVYRLLFKTDGRTVESNSQF
jgi:hypothetical protein